MADSPRDPDRIESAPVLKGASFAPLPGRGGILIDRLTRGAFCIPDKYRDQKRFFRFLGKAARDRKIIEAIGMLRDSVIRGSLANANRGEGIIAALTGVRGREGVSFLSMMLAVSLGAFTHRRVAFLDSHFNAKRFDALTEVLGLSQNAFHMKGTVTRIVGFYKVAQPNVYFLKNEGSERGMEFFSDKQLQRFLDDLRRNFDFTIIDMPPLAKEPTGVFLAPSLDQLFLVAQAGKTRARDLDRCLESCRESNVQISGVVLNRQRAPFWSHLFWRDFFFAPRTYVPLPAPMFADPSTVEYVEPLVPCPSPASIATRGQARIEGPAHRQGS